MGAWIRHACITLKVEISLADYSSSIMNVKILIVDDHPMIRHGLSDVVKQRPNLTWVGEAPTGAAGLALARELSPDLAVMDIHLPDMSGLEATRQMFTFLPLIKVLIFSGETGREFVDESLLAGAHGYLSKSSAPEELVQAIDAVMAGRLYLSPQVSDGILEDYRQKLVTGSEPEKPVLSERERHVLQLVAEGRRNKEIADALTLSTKSVEALRYRIMKKLKCSSAAELVRYAVRAGIAAA
jgi:DNA-binding NarL/FixJ family response regulator